MPDRRLTVLQLLPALESGGVERGTLEIGKALSLAGHRSLVMSSGGRMVAQLESEGSTHFTWEIRKKSPWTLRHIWPLRRFLQEHNVDIVHARSRVPAWIAYLAWKGMAASVRPRFITTVHGLYSVNPYSAVMTRGERVIAVSNTVRGYILDNYPDVDPERIVVIPRGVDRSQYPSGYRPTAAWLAHWQDTYPQLAGKAVITLPGRITRLKGHEDFIELIERLHKHGCAIHGLIVGGAESSKVRYLNELKQRIRERKLQDHITFTGHRSDLKEILAISTIVLSLSKTPESFGRTVLEALSLGIPCAGYDHGGVGEQLREMLPEGAISPGDMPQLQTLVTRWLAAPPAIPAEHRFTLDNMCTATLRLYREMAAEMSASRP